MGKAVAIIGIVACLAIAGYGGYLVGQGILELYPEMMYAPVIGACTAIALGIGFCVFLHRRYSYVTFTYRFK